MERLRVTPKETLWYPDGNAVMDSYGEDLLENDRYHHVDLLNYIGFKRATLIDVGAYVGVFTTWARSKGVDKAFCFEPCFENYKCLVANQNNYSLWGDYRAFPYALTDKTGSTRLCGKGQKAIVKDLPYDVPMGTDEPIMGVAFDDFYDCLELSTEEHIIIKMDIEGKEVSALGGAVNFLRSHKKITLILCTYHYTIQYYDVGLALEHLIPEIDYISAGEINGNNALMIASNWRSFN